jgi:hypothetical protein
VIVALGGLLPIVMERSCLAVKLQGLVQKVAKTKNSAH